MKKILFPTDFSPAAKNAFEYAKKLAVEFGSQIDVLNVYSLPVTDASSVPPDYIQQLIEDRKVRVEENLEKFVGASNGGLTINKFAEYGLFVAHEVKDYVTNQKHDLVVMGTKGERNVIAKLMGSATTETMMTAPRPVLAIPAEATYKGIRKIAYATDFSLADTPSVKQLIEFAKTFDAEIHFVHVDVEQRFKQPQTTAYLEKYPFEFTDFTLVGAHSVMEGLDNFIKENDIDLLALFIPKRKLWERLFHNSFTKKMTFHSEVPLLVFHE